MQLCPVKTLLYCCKNTSQRHGPWSTAGKCDVKQAALEWQSGGWVQQPGEGCPRVPALLTCLAGAQHHGLLPGGLSSTRAGVPVGKSSSDAWFRLPWITTTRGWDHAEPSFIHHGLLPRWGILLHLSWTLMGSSLQLQQAAFT